MTFEQVQGADAPLPALPPPKDTLAKASASGPISPMPLQSLQPLRSLWREATWAWTWSLQWNVPNCQQRQLATFHFAKPMETNPRMPTILHHTGSAKCATLRNAPMLWDNEQWYACDMAHVACAHFFEVRLLTSRSFWQSDKLNHHCGWRQVTSTLYYSFFLANVDAIPPNFHISQFCSINSFQPELILSIHYDRAAFRSLVAGLDSWVLCGGKVLGRLWQTQTRQLMWAIEVWLTWLTWGRW